MKYIGFEVKPLHGDKKKIVIVKKYLNNEKGVALNHTWRLRDYLFDGFNVNVDITSFPATHADYANYKRRQYSSYEKIVALLR